MKFLLQRILALLARSTLRRYRPVVVGVTGSVGKTSAKEAIFAVLSARYRARRSEKNYNTEIGVPLTVLGLPHYGKNAPGWLFGFGRTAWRLIVRDSAFPELLVLEMGADRPGDIAYLVGVAPPQVAVITAVGEVPVHVEFFAGPRELAEEKANLVAGLDARGTAVLNHDDPAVLAMRKRARGRVLTYGFAADATVRIVKQELRAEALESGQAGIEVTLAHGGDTAAVRLRNSFGNQQAYAAAAGACAGIALGLGFAEAVMALAGYESPPGRLKLIRAHKAAWILDDTYNASPASTSAALAVLAAFPAERRIAVLGDMLELGRFSEHAHRAVGEGIAGAADCFIAVGQGMRFAFDSAKLGEKFWFKSAEEAGRALEALLRPGDIVLVKGSQSVRMERVVEEIMAEPQRAGELLVRQSVDWRVRR